jgi:hypothetical protein
MVLLRLLLVPMIGDPCHLPRVERRHGWERPCFTLVSFRSRANEPDARVRDRRRMLCCDEMVGCLAPLNYSHVTSSLGARANATTKRGFPFFSLPASTIE